MPLCVNSYSLCGLCAAGILMVVPLPYLLYDNLAIKMYARERRERSQEFIIIEQLGTKQSERCDRWCVLFLVRVIIRLVIIISKFSLHQI